jgi:hypothetical protein
LVIGISLVSKNESSEDCVVDGEVEISFGVCKFFASVYLDDGVGARVTAWFECEEERVG